MKVLPLMLISLFCSCQGGSGTLTVAASEQADSLRQPWDSIPVDSSEVFTCVSEDGAMKFYCWNTGLGGTMPIFEVICQYRKNDGGYATKYMSDIEGEAAWVSAVHSLKKDDGAVYYVAARSHRASSNDGYMWVDVFMIDHDTLRKVSLEDVVENYEESAWDVNYSISYWYYATNGYGEDWLFEFDASEGNLYVPQTVDVGGMVPMISDRYRVYHFDKGKFVYHGESAHKGLHESLSDYDMLASYFRTKNHIARVDWVEHKTALRLALWNSITDMSKKPDVVIRGGKYDEEERIYTFTDGEREYVVGYGESVPVSDGVSIYHEYLLIRNGGKVVLKEERDSPYIE